MMLSQSKSVIEHVVVHIAVHISDEVKGGFRICEGGGGGVLFISEK